MDDMEDLRDVSAVLAAPRPEDAVLVENIQQQLITIVHAMKCQEREYESDDDDPSEECTVPYCSTMKTALNHMVFCQEGGNCTEPHCISTVKIVVHWKCCHKTDCRICCPFKPLDVPKEWHDEESIPQLEQRINVIDLLMQIIGPYTGTLILGKRVYNKEWFAKKLEDNLYKQADSLIDYYRMAAEKMRALEVDIEERIKEYSDV